MYLRKDSFNRIEPGTVGRQFHQGNVSLYVNYDRLLAITQAKSITKKIVAFIRYRLVKGRLLNKRDRFIVKRIDETLNHNIKERLPRDIQITEVKVADKVREYQM